MEVVDDADVVNVLAAGAPDLVGQLPVDNLVIPDAAFEVAGALIGDIGQFLFADLVEDASAVVPVPAQAVLRMEFH